ncbi:MAG: DUF4335 domain-containing protein [Leptolyngbyaceae cyanobacterium bins.349]|nr:DUF4335 domain-containing protein [Leptolyngbyaceae cyanobacterium bins.349]
MARSHSVLRRYTPPTCTLEVIAKDSVLSRWAGQSVVKDLRFQLSLDDPKLPREEWVVVRGDRTQLEALAESVSNYVQSFLELPPDHLTLVQAHEGDAASMPPLATDSRPAIAIAESPVGIVLQPKGWLNHEVHWGALATAETGAVTHLSTLQLFDLATALDTYSTDLLSLPTQTQPAWIKSFPNWAQVAAVVLVAVGLSTSAIRLLDGASTMAPMASQGASSSDQKIATQLPPAVVDKATPPVISNQKLPPPPPATIAPTPTPGTPNVAVPKLPPPSPASGTVSPGAIAAYPVPVVPGSPTVIRGQVEAAPPVQSISPAASAPIASRPAPEVGSEEPSPMMARRGAAADTAAANSTAFDTIPQVAEVRSYFEQRWKPPEGLSQILEYSIQLDGNGSIKTVSPLRQASGEYIDRTEMPLIGETFVSPLKGRSTAKIRLVLEPNGQVRTFLEE